MKVLVTGATGFIGSHFIKYMLTEFAGVHSVVGLDSNCDTLAEERVKEVEDEKFSLIYKDLFRDDISEILEKVDVVVHFAAKTFVDHSVRYPRSHFNNTVAGTFNLLECARKSLNKDLLFVLVSTDEVFGEQQNCPEDGRLMPTNPYSACKAAAEMLAMGYQKTYGLNLVITRCENNYGSYQHPQKVIPVYIRSALENMPLPVYNDGKNKRRWIYVQDHCDALCSIIDNYTYLGETQFYNITGGLEICNLDLAKLILRTFDRPEDDITFIDTSTIRPYHDKEYSMVSTNKGLEDIWYIPQTANRLDDLEKTIKWYDQNRRWLY